MLTLEQAAWVLVIEALCHMDKSSQAINRPKLTALPRLPLVVVNVQHPADARTGLPAAAGLPGLAACAMEDAPGCDAPPGPRGGRGRGRGRGGAAGSSSGGKQRDDRGRGRGGGSRGRKRPKQQQQSSDSSNDTDPEDEEAAAPAPLRHSMRRRGNQGTAALVSG